MTIRTARLRTSDENLFVTLLVIHLTQELEPPPPLRFNEQSRSRILSDTYQPPIDGEEKEPKEHQQRGLTLLPSNSRHAPANL